MMHNSIGRNLLRGTRKFVEWEFTSLLDKNPNDHIEDREHDCVVYKQQCINGHDDGNYRYVDFRKRVDFLPDTVYTLSFWAKGTGTIGTFMYPYANERKLATSGQPGFTEWPDCHTDYELTDEWKKHHVTFLTKSDIGGGEEDFDRAVVIFRTYEGSTMFLRQPKLEYGGQATQWVPALEDGEYEFINPNIANGTSYEWSAWLTPYHNVNNAAVSFIWNKIPVDYIESNRDLWAYLEIECRNVTFTPVEERDESTANAYGINIQGQFNGDCWYVDDTGKPTNDTSITVSWLTNVQPFNGPRYRDTGNFKIIHEKKFDMKDILERYPGIHGRQILSVGYRINWWATGQLRYRMICCKTGELNNPIYSKSPVDAANPNLITANSEGVEKWFPPNSGLTRDDVTGNIEVLEDIVIPGAPHVTTGYRVTNTSPVGSYGIHFRFDEDLIQGETVTYSFWGRRLNEGFSELAWSLQTQGEGGYEDGQKYCPITNVGEWKHYKHTIKVDQRNLSWFCIFYLAQSGCIGEIAGVKVEYGDRATAYIP